MVGCASNLSADEQREHACYIERLHSHVFWVSFNWNCKWEASFGSSVTADGEFVPKANGDPQDLACRPGSMKVLPPG